MNKYKMISICSFMITCVLVMSILLPVKTTANDEESIELNMHYENSQVITNISVNSEVYTGVVCKYIIIDDVLKSDDLLKQTKENGTTINLNKSDSNEYQTIIPNVTKRYVVIYVSIGECSLCDYIDCKPNGSNSSDTPASNEGTENKGTQEINLTVQGEGNDGQNTETNNDNNAQTNKEDNKENNTEQKDEQKNENNSNNDADNNNKVENEKKDENKSTENNKEDEKQENVNQQSETKKDENAEQKGEVNAEEKTTEQKSENKQEDKIVVDNKADNNTNGFESIEEASNKKEDTAKNNDGSKTTTSQKGADTTGANSEKNSKTNSELKTTASNYDKDSIDTSDFQEIEKTVTTSTASDNMPKTGEDDFVKIMGIIVFSALSFVSFYKYMKTK